MGRYSLLVGFLLLILACGNTVPENELEFLFKKKIVVPEPSGLTYHKGSLFAISDAVPVLYQLSLSGILEAKFEVDKKGLEGVAYHEELQSFVLLSESKRSITYYSLKNGKGKSHKVKGKQKSENNGLEGICYNSNKQSLYVINESKPKKLLRISKKGNLKKEYKLGFGKDVSGIVYDSKLDVFWVLSDESQALYKVSKKGKNLQKFSLKISKPEGIALDENRRIYIVSDLSSELFVYQLK